MANKAYKGSELERDICRRLSLWWTGNERDDVFWRTSISGGRATARAAKGKSTFGQVGDIQAVDPIGSLLVQTCTIEVKRGYSRYSLMDLLDAPRIKSHPWSLFLQQAVVQQRTAGTPYWLLITRRDRSQPLIFMPPDLYNKLLRVDAWDYGWDAWDYGWDARIMVRIPVNGDEFMTVCGMTLSSFFEEVPPETFTQL